jgi:hypothetical protein
MQLYRTGKDGRRRSLLFPNRLLQVRRGGQHFLLVSMLSAFTLLLSDGVFAFDRFTISISDRQLLCALTDRNRITQYTVSVCTYMGRPFVIQYRPIHYSHRPSGRARFARLDAPGVVHHVVIRGIERRKILPDDESRLL